MTSNKERVAEKGKITVNQVPIEWSDRRDRFTFFGIEGIIFWKDPSLLSILGPLRDELGEELYSLLIAYEVAKGTYDDYYAMVENLGASFEEGFVNWGRAVSGAGWGTFDLQAIDWNEGRARVRIGRPWETFLFRAKDPQHAIPFLNGKLSGIFSWAFDRHCRATVEDIDPSADGHVTVSIAPSTMTLERELEQLREQRGLSETQYLQILNRELRTHLDRFFEVVEAAGEFVCEMDRQFRIMFTTRTLPATLGYDENALEGRDLRELLTADGRAVLSSWVEREQHETLGELEIGVRTAAGELRWLAIGINPMREMRGATTGYRCAGRDVTDARRAKEELRLMAAAFRSSQAVIITDGEGRIERINRGFEIISGHAADAILGRDLRSMGVDDQARESLGEALDRAVTDGIWEGEVWYGRADGEGFPVWQSVTACRDDNGCLEHLVAVFHDISEQKRLERQLEWQATHDYLTGLCNRSLLEQFVAREIERARRYGRPLALLLIDVDYFKDVNDALGHSAGDEVLRELARCLQDTIRGSDVAARWGGEEFMLLAPETNAEQGLALAEKVRTLIGERTIAQAGAVTVSIGVTGLAEGDRFEDLFRRVDEALYAAKADGRDCCRVR